jgi:hypothetical protein
VLVPEAPVVEEQEGEPLELSLEESVASDDEPPYTDAIAALDFDPAFINEELASDEPEPTPISDGIERHTVYTARYRFVIKGPDRGRWEADVVEEADAPLVTVETVVRGVQRRAGEDTDIVRYNAHQLARALRLPQP